MVVNLWEEVMVYMILVKKYPSKEKTLVIYYGGREIVVHYPKEIIKYIINDINGGVIFKK